MEFDNILLLMQQFSQLGLSKMELSYEHFSIKLEKEENVNTVSKSIAPEIIEVPKAARTETKTDTETAERLIAGEV